MPTSKPIATSAGLWRSRANRDHARAGITASSDMFVGPPRGQRSVNEKSVSHQSSASSIPESYSVNASMHGRLVAEIAVILSVICVVAAVVFLSRGVENRSHAPLAFPHHEGGTTRRV